MKLIQKATLFILVLSFISIPAYAAESTGSFNRNSKSEQEISQERAMKPMALKPGEKVSANSMNHNSAVESIDWNSLKKQLGNGKVGRTKNN